jgi:hypothetical protein
MGEMEAWERCLWALRLEVEPSIVNDVTKHVTEKIDALRTALANLVDEVAAQPLADETGELAARLDEALAVLTAPGRGATGGSDG